MKKCILPIIVQEQKQVMIFFCLLHRCGDDVLPSERSILHTEYEPLKSAAITKFLKLEDKTKLFTTKFTFSHV